MRQRITAGAAGLVGLSSLRKATRQVPDDCTGLVWLVYGSAGVELAGDVESLYRLARVKGAVHHSKPRPGDLAFFRETYDRNRDGLRNDGLTHVGVVESVERDGTVTFIHRGSAGVARAQMDPRRPHLRSHEGEKVNDFLRAASGKRRAYLAGELFADYASAEALAGGAREGLTRAPTARGKK